MISGEEELFADGLRLSEASQHVRAATALGLVARDAGGEIIPGLADRWIVTDDGQSYIFRLREGIWADGRPLDATSAQDALRTAMRRLRGTSLELDVAPVVEVRAMAGRVIELRLSGSFPTLLQLLAQPELALDPQQGSGDMALRRDDIAILTLKPPEARGLPADDAWQGRTRPIRLAPLTARNALAAFDKGAAQVVLGGTLASLPLVDTGPLSRGTIRIDPAIGLFGLHVRSDTGALADESVRGAIAMSIDRGALLGRFGVGGWLPTTRVVNPGLADDPGIIPERWSERSIEELRAAGARRVAEWRSQQPEPPEGPLTLTLEIGSGPGLDLLFGELAQQLRQIGIVLLRAADGDRGDLLLVDRPARYADARWFLNQFNCSLRQGLCDENADELVRLAVQQADLTRRARLLAEAEAELTLANVYIPFGPPLRWSLIRGNVGGFRPNRWAFHPLPPMAEVAR